MQEPHQGSGNETIIAISKLHFPEKKAGHCAGHISANIRPQQLHWSANQYRIVGNFREVKIFAIFVTHNQNAKIRTTKYENRENLNTNFWKFLPCAFCALVSLNLTSDNGTTALFQTHFCLPRAREPGYKLSSIQREIFAGPNFHENPISSPEEIFVVLNFCIQRELLTTPLYRHQANGGRKMSCGKGQDVICQTYVQ